MEKLKKFAGMTLNFIVVVCGFMLLVFNVRANSLISEQLIKVPMNNNPSVLMSKVNISNNSPLQSELDGDYWLANMEARIEKWLKNSSLRKNILALVHFEANAHGLDPLLVLSVITVESHFDTKAKSSYGAQGLMQIMPFWLKEFAVKNGSLFDYRINIRLGCAILKHYLDREKGDLFRALARYNGSLGQSKYALKVFNTYQQLKLTDNS
ncbi:MAG: lytic transglycosylase domain-containing protein [Neisseriales bacterium]|nr:MAG: lytic transglycosylase domain-containing protein [Neisseriales bacterium]